MTRTIQILRGTEAQNDAFTGAIGELTMDTTNNEIRIHDGSTVGGHKIGGYHPDLFDRKWADHQVNDVQWLRADTFSWQNGSVYQAAYQHLADDITGKTLQSETVGGTTIQFYLADDGHKICPASEESNVAAIYAATGVAWYYILDTTNQRFKLPRINPDKDLLNVSADVAVRGDGKTLGVTTDGSTTSTLKRRDIDGTVQYLDYNATLGSTQGNRGISTNATNAYSLGVIADSTKSGLTGTADLANATGYYKGHKYLYFYVGNFTQTALENTAGLNASLFNNKADLDFANTNMIDYVIEKQDPTAGNNYMWYRKYKSGWVEQGGYVSGQGDGVNNTITYPVAFTSRVCDYNVHNTRGSGADQYAFQIGVTADPGLTSMVVRTVCNGTTNYVWSVKGI